MQATVLHHPHPRRPWPQPKLQLHERRHVLVHWNLIRLPGHAQLSLHPDRQRRLQRHLLQRHLLQRLKLQRASQKRKASQKLVHWNLIHLPGHAQLSLHPDRQRRLQRHLLQRHLLQRLKLQRASQKRKASQKPVQLKKIPQQ
eukprot:PhF_6_TR6886/c0_g2_i1/m.9929